MLKIINFLKDSSMIKDNDIYLKIFNKDKKFLYLLEKVNKSNDSNYIFIEELVNCIEIIDFLVNEVLSLPKLYIEKSVLEINNENEDKYMLLFLNMLSNMLSYTNSIFINMYNKSLKKQDIQELQNEFITKLNPIDYFNDDDLTIILDNNNFNDVHKEIINITREKYQNKLMEFIEKSINVLN
tara:strand:- start:53 stop:601 length:549 start_codon:yes stop_codon:yes gene_type:complete